MLEYWMDRGPASVCSAHIYSTRMASSARYSSVDSCLAKTVDCRFVYSLWVPQDYCCWQSDSDEPFVLLTHRTDHEECWLASSEERTSVDRYLEGSVPSTDVDVCRRRRIWPAKDADDQSYVHWDIRLHAEGLDAKRENKIYLRVELENEFPWWRRQCHEDFLSIDHEWHVLEWFRRRERTVQSVCSHRIFLTMKISRHHNRSISLPGRFLMYRFVPRVSSHLGRA